jgi:hypothetical protein
MYEELLTDVYYLTMYDPCIQLVVENFVTIKKDFGEHVFDYWVTRSAFFVKSIQDFSASFGLFFNFKHQGQDSWEHLEINLEFLLEGKYGQRSILKIFSLYKDNVLLVDREHLSYTRTKGFDINAIEHRLFLIFTVRGIFLLLFLPVS